MKDYRNYRLSWKVRLGAALAGGVLFGIISGIFFRNVWGCAAAVAAGTVIAPAFWRKHEQQKVQRCLRLEFRECLSMMVPVLRTGRSLEGAIEALCEDMDPEETVWMYPEIEGIRNGLSLHQSAEDLFEDLGMRSGIEDIQDFAEIIRISKRSQGNIAAVMDHTARILEEKMEAEEELRVILAKRKMEQRLLNASPFLVVFMLFMMSPGYLDPLYTTLQGKMAMIFCVGLMAFSYWLSGRLSRVSI